MRSTMNPPHEKLRAESVPKLGELVILELPRLRAFVERLVRGMNPPVEADDIVQESVARALRYHDSFDATRPIGPWLCKLALRLVLDRRAALRRDEQQRADFARGKARDIDSHFSPVGEQEAFDHWTARLSLVERDILLRFHQHCESLREIACALSLPEGTVKSHLHRARKKLAQGEA